MTDDPANLLHSLEVYLRAMDAFLGGLNSTMGGRLFRSYEALVLHTGRRFVAAPLPADVEPGSMRYCYANTVQLTAAREDLLYCEGYAIPVVRGWEGVPVQHAWAVTPDGQVVDPTWPEPEHSAYWGIVFSRADVGRFIEISEDTFGILPAEYLIGFPLLRTGQLFPEDADG